jgi:amidophosphoribosyltransferase
MRIGSVHCWRIMCGIIGISARRHVAADLYEGLIQLQHRGQDAAGIVSFDGHFHLARGQGFVREAFTESSLGSLFGSLGIAHTRYTTAGAATLSNTQPFLTNTPYGIAIVHNGNLINYHELREELRIKDRFHCNSESDTEVLLGVLATEMGRIDGHQDFFEILSTSMTRVFERVVGAYSVVGIIAGKGLFAFRDPHGIRPLVWGIREDAPHPREVIFSSENTMYAPLEFSLGGDVHPGELVFVDQDGEMHRRQLTKSQFTPCAFEYVYFARPDSHINNISVYRARLRMGENLAKKWKRHYPEVVPDIVVPVPFSAGPMALSFAHRLGVRYSEALYKNAFIGRTFIMPGSDHRKLSIKRKLSPQPIELDGRDVLVVDDSIVRGATSRLVVNLVRSAGARRVYFASACPPVVYPDFYGIDIPTRRELIAAHKTEEEIRKHIGCDILLYQDIEDLVEAITRKGAHTIDRLSMPYLDGWYVTGDLSEKHIRQLEKRRTVERGHQFSES